MQGNLPSLVTKKPVAISRNHNFSRWTLPRWRGRRAWSRRAALTARGGVGQMRPERGPAARRGRRAPTRSVRVDGLRAASNLCKPARPSPPARRPAGRPPAVASPGAVGDVARAREGVPPRRGPAVAARIPRPLRFRRGGGRFPASLRDARGPAASPCSRPALLAATAFPHPGPHPSPPPLRGAAPAPAATAFRSRGDERERREACPASAAAASSDRRRARAEQTGGRRRSARPRERARSRSGARGARGPEEGRGEGWAGPSAERNQSTSPGGGASSGPAPLSRCAWPAPASGPRAEAGLRRLCWHEIAVPPARAPRALPPSVGWAGRFL